MGLVCMSIIKVDTDLIYNRVKKHSYWFGFYVNQKGKHCFSLHESPKVDTHLVCMRVKNVDTATVTK